MAIKAIKKAKPKKRSPQEIIPPGFVANDDLLSQAIWQFFSGLNQDAKKGLKNKADITSLLPLLMMVAGVIEFLRRPRPPKWNEWMWYSYSMFRDMNSEKKKIPHFHQEGFDKKE